MTSPLPSEGFTLARVVLVNCNFGVGDPGLLLEDSELVLKVESRVIEVGPRKNGDFTVVQTIYAAPHNRSWTCQVTHLGVFQFDEKNAPVDAEAARRVSAPATLYPYARELVSDITNRSGIRATLPLTNFDQSTNGQPKKRSAPSKGKKARRKKTD